jgi:hypothetical protein
MELSPMRLGVSVAAGAAAALIAMLISLSGGTAGFLGLLIFAAIYFGLPWLRRV